MEHFVDLVPIDNHFAGFIRRLSPEGGEDLYLAAALTSMATRLGHACLDLSAWAGCSILTITDKSYMCPKLSVWISGLAACSAVGAEHDAAPLVLVDDRLYLRRYFEYENDVAKFVIGRGEQADAEVDMRSLSERMDRLFPGQPEGCDWQRLAALVAVIRPFVVITGGPGTGKTTTVAKLLALLLEHHPEKENFRIALTAPTGKAVMRLQGIMASVKTTLACSESIRELIPIKVITLHRLLGFRKDSSLLKYDKNNQLPYELVVVDEASMVDLPLMAKLMRALRPDTKLVLLGDHNQLASVEPGAVLGDICSQEALPVFSKGFIAKASAVTMVENLSIEGDGQTDSLVELQDSHRFGVKSGIGLVGQAINVGDSDGALEIFQDDNYPDVVFRNIGSEEHLQQELSDKYNQKPPGWFGVAEPEKALRCLGSFQVLCAVHQGVFGVSNVNRCIEEILAEKWSVVPEALSYVGRPVMIADNNYELQLFNGDTGIVLTGQLNGEGLLAFFPDGGEGVRKIPLALLPEHKTAYAMTVHKSQGSEFDEVVVVLPDWQSAVLSRELLYTALTRAGGKVEVWGSKKIFMETIKSVISRHGGLRDKLRLD